MQLRHIRKYEENDNCHSDYPPDISLHHQTELTEMKEDLGKFRCGTLILLYTMSNFIALILYLYRPRAFALVRRHSSVECEKDLARVRANHWAMYVNL